MYIVTFWGLVLDHDQAKIRLNRLQFRNGYGPLPENVNAFSDSGGFRFKRVSGGFSVDHGGAGRVARGAASGTGGAASDGKVIGAAARGNFATSRAAKSLQCIIFEREFYSAIVANASSIKKISYRKTFMRFTRIRIKF